MVEHYLSDLPLWSDPEAKKVLADLCAKHAVPISVLEDLVAIQRERQSQERADGVYQVYRNFRPDGLIDDVDIQT